MHSFDHCDVFFPSSFLGSKVVMLLIALVNPHVLLLDEPTNHLDMRLGQDGSVRFSGSKTQSLGVFYLDTFLQLNLLLQVSPCLANLLIEPEGNMHTTMKHVRENTKQGSQTWKKTKHDALFMQLEGAWRGCREKKSRLASDCLEIRPWTKINRGTQWFHTREQMMYASPM